MGVVWGITELFLQSYKLPVRGWTVPICDCFSADDTNCAERYRK